MLKIKPNKKNIGAEIVVNLKEITNLAKTSGIPKGVKDYLLT